MRIQLYANERAGLYRDEKEEIIKNLFLTSRWFLLRKKEFVV